MRTTLLALVLALSLAACGKKKAPASPSNDAPPAADEQPNEETNMATPDDPDDAARTSDPCEGGE